MAERRREPGRGAVAGVARSGGDHVIRCLATGAGAVVASGAGAGNDAGMAERRREPGRGAVAGVARSGGDHVIRCLATGAGTVVASGAGAGNDPGVVEESRLVGRGPVARVAGSRGRNVARGLSGRLPSVVAGGAGSRLNADVAEAGARERSGGVAGLAGLRYRHVVRRHDYGRDPAHRGVTRRALPGRAFENASGVARFAARDLVRAGQRKARAQMVKTARRLRAGGTRCECGQGNQDDRRQRGK